ncbi:MAG TPA: DUF2889 domain-containing protein [Spongiibacteraceae bacterium]|nr:DUF2889 domain-containing protein [Spongiibacteraceae bacterium]
MSEVVASPPRKSAGAAPLRVPGSVRRTSTIDISWPEGFNHNSRAVGRARDIFTPRSGGAPVVRAEDSFIAALSADRHIVSIESSPPRPALTQLIGARGGGHLRKILKEIIPEEFQHAAPLYLILDDISGASLVSAWAWSLWNPHWLEESKTTAELQKTLADMEGVCIGFAPGSSALSLSTDNSLGTPVPDLRRADDPEGWHAFTAQEGNVGMRRARRIDLWIDDVLVIDAAFQDSATTPAGGRAAIHEYRLRATADPKTMRVLSIHAEPRILPFVECPSAVFNMSRLVGTTLMEFREKVLADLRGTHGCTHLNDALRALADVPMLMRYLD